ncbi:unnamed protein product [Phytomonas sp. EM1]|nr:unnamed protein product [Phytomonas sp. EM1]|eukprot:CCW64307.1 unnamed protein product [Phytomonas sp. isolate EM1]
MVTGNVSVFFGGYLVLGPDWHLMLSSCLFIVLGSAAFVYINVFTNICVAVVCLSIISFVLLLLCAFLNPGILVKEPAPPSDTAPHESRWVDVEYSKSDGTRAVAKLEEKWCYSCNIYRPLRAVHCRFCDVCILRRDHHCPWTGICIGAGNYTAYFALLWLVLALTIVAFVGGVVSLIRRTRSHTQANSKHDPLHGFYAALSETYCLELFLILISVIWVVLIASLALKHTYLISKNMTSLDYLKSDNENIFEQGSYVENIRHSLCYFSEACIQSTRTLRDATSQRGVIIVESV